MNNKPILPSPIDPQRRNFIKNMIKIGLGSLVFKELIYDNFLKTSKDMSSPDQSTELAEEEEVVIKIENKDIIAGPREELIEFANYLKEIKLQSLGINRKSTLGAFLRVFRYYKIIRDNEINGGKTPIPKNYLLGLGMIEGYGDPASVNETDGGAGIIHMQSSTVREMRNKLGMPHFKTIYDFIEENKDDKFAQKIKKYLGPDATSHKKLGSLFQDMLAKGDKDVTVDSKNNDLWLGWTDLYKIDHRFEPNECIQFAAKFLQYIHNRILKTYKENTQNDSRIKYKDDKDFPFTWTLAINAYNKGPNGLAYLRDFAGSKKIAGNHILNFKRNLIAARKYIDYIYPELKLGKSPEEVLVNLIRKFNPNDI